MSILQDMIQFATEIHSGQVRRGSKLPYIVHPMDVLSILVAHGVKDEDVLAAGVGHDMVEDHPDKVTLEQIEKRFGPRVSRMISDLSKDPGISGYAARRAHMFGKLQGGPLESRIIKMADRLSNIRTIQDLSLRGRKPYLLDALQIAEMGRFAHPTLSCTLTIKATQLLELASFIAGR